MRRVPAHLAEFDQRKHVRIALKTKDEREAQKLAGVYDDFIERYWRGLISAGRSDDDYEIFHRACACAKAYGFAYKDTTSILESSLDEILSRIETASSAPRLAQNALLGGVKLPRLKLSECLDRFWPLCADRLTEKSDNQIRKYKNPRILAMKNLIQVAGDIDLQLFGRTHVLEFRRWLMDRIAGGEIKGDAANKQMRHAKDILHTVSMNSEIGTNLKLLFAETGFKVEWTSRTPFEADYVQVILLGEQALQGMNPAGRVLIHMMAETGARESEIIGLEEQDIFTNEPIPYIWIRKNDIRALKNKTTERKIPLVGAALTAARIFTSSGMPRYQRNPDSASTAINKFLRANNLNPSPGHSLYSLRHTFKDRLRDAGAPEEVTDELMGHKRKGIPYGRGHTLKTKYQWLQKIAFEPSETL